MAIREYGESLLRRQSAKRDERESQERKRERRARKDELKLGAAVWLGKEALGMAKTAIGRKTNNFLANSNLYDNKILVDKGIKETEKYVNYINEAKDKNISLPSYFLNQTADKALAVHQSGNPFDVKKGTESAWKAAFMTRQSAIDYAQEQADYALKVQKLGQEVAGGRSSASLDSLARQSRPSTVLGSVFNMLRGKEITNVETFNTQMNLTKQVVASKSILESQAELASSFSDKGNLFLAQLAAPEIDAQKLKEATMIKNFEKAGELETAQTTQYKIVNNDLVEIKSTLMTRPDGSTYLKQSPVTSVFTGIPSAKDAAEATRYNSEALKNAYSLVSQTRNREGQLEFKEYIEKNYGNQEGWTAGIYSELTLIASSGVGKDGKPWTSDNTYREQLSAPQTKAIIESYAIRVSKLDEELKTYQSEMNNMNNSEEKRDTAYESYIATGNSLNDIEQEVTRRLQSREADLDPAPEGEIIKRNNGEFYKTSSGEFPITIENGKTIYRIGKQIFQINRESDT